MAINRCTGCNMRISKTLTRGDKCTVCSEELWEELRGLGLPDDPTVQPSLMRINNLEGRTMEEVEGTRPKVYHKGGI